MLFQLFYIFITGNFICSWSK